MTQSRRPDDPFRLDPPQLRWSCDSSCFSFEVYILKLSEAFLSSLTLLFYKSFIFLLFPSDSPFNLFIAYSYFYNFFSNICVYFDILKLSLYKFF